MAGPLHYIVVAAILAGAVANSNVKNEGVNEKSQGIFVNGTTTNVTRLDNGVEGTRGLDSGYRIQFGNITTSTNSTSPGKTYVYCPLYWQYGLYWTTPDFGISNYPNNADCGLSGFGGPAMALFTFQPLDVQKKVNGKCVDYFEMSFPYGVIKRWCGKSKVQKFYIPSYNYQARFISDNKITRPGFNVSIDILSSPCHTYVYLYNVGDSGEFSTPDYPSIDTKKNRMCELIVYTTWGNHVQLDFLDFDLNSPCTKNNVIVNLESQYDYPKDTSYRYCGTSLPPSTVSTYEQVHLVYQANKRNKGFKVRYTAVSGSTTFAP